MPSQVVSTQTPKVLAHFHRHLKKTGRSLEKRPGQHGYVTPFGSLYYSEEAEGTTSKELVSRREVTFLHKPEHRKVGLKLMKDVRVGAFGELSPGIGQGFIERGR